MDCKNESSVWDKKIAVIDRISSEGLIGIHFLIKMERCSYNVIRDFKGLWHMKEPFILIM